MKTKSIQILHKVKLFVACSIGTGILLTTISGFAETTLCTFKQKDFTKSPSDSNVYLAKCHANRVSLGHLLTADYKDSTQERNPKIMMIYCGQAVSLVPSNDANDASLVYIGGSHKKPICIVQYMQDLPMSKNASITIKERRIYFQEIWRVLSRLFQL